MFRPKISVAMAVLAAFLLSFPFLVSDDETEAMPGRTVVQESEANDGWTSADALPSSAGSSYELHGNITSSDPDYFYFTLTGGSGPVDEVTIVPNWIGTNYTNQYFVAWIWSFYPDNDLSHSQSDEMSKAIRIWNENYYTWYNALTFRADHSGNYGMIIRSINPPVSGTLQYNLSVSISSVTPTDPYNDQASSMDLTISQVLSGSLHTETDQFDWYHLNAPDPVHPTTLDLDLSLNNYEPDYTSGVYEFGIEVDIDVHYNSRSSPNTFSKKSFRVSPQSNFQKDGCMANPANIKVTRNCTEMYMSMRIITHGLDSNGNINYNDRAGETSYNADIGIIPEIPNKRPYLKDREVEPTVGRSSDIFRFSIDYYDPDNETPRQVWLWRDGEEFREMSPVSGAENADHSLGVEYYIEVPGSLLGKNEIHVMNISAWDGEDWAMTSLSALEPFTVKVDDNLPPSSAVGEKYNVEMEEDDITFELDLEPLFTDPDPVTDFSFQILDRGGEWSTTYRDENITAALRKPQSQNENTRLLITPGRNVFGTFSLQINATDDANFEKSAILEIEVVVEPVNDPPRIERIGSKSVDEGDTLIRFDQEEQDNKVILDVQATDIDGDNLTYTWNIQEALANPEEGEIFHVNENSGEMWFIPTDDDVGTVELQVIVDDGSGGEVEMDIDVNVENVNDPPVISLPGERSTVEGEFLYISPGATDPDMDDNDRLVFGYDLGELGFVTPPNAIDWDPNTGRLAIEAISEDMNGEWDITITVSDLALLSDSATCSVVIQNINDPPVADVIGYDTVEGNLTVSFHTTEATDADGDELVYIWNFGDGSDEERGEQLTSVEHEYSDEGSYSVSLKVFDGEAYSEEKTEIITVVGPEPDTDKDDDGIPDEWELEYGLDPSEPQDVEDDPDGDGLTSLEEYDLLGDYGWKLNPMNPDSDMDGWKDGKEVSDGFDPTDPNDHPQGKYSGFPLILYLVALLVLFLAVMFAVVFLVLKKRNKPKAVASAVYPGPAAYPEQPLPSAQYQQVGEGQITDALPSAQQPYRDDEGEQQVYGGQYTEEMDQEQVPQQEYDPYPDELYGKIDQQSSDPYQQPKYQDPYSQQAEQQEPPTPHEEPVQETDEVPQDHSEGEKDENSSIPPPPSFPDI